uniref:Mytilin K n=1 Tax=Mytilus galloprovincialis TaxID=29158 RepID=A0A0C5PW33_MYTGA|nr:Mytilin K [Mytilus galloprovincialis]
MKVAIILAFALAVALAIHEADAYLSCRQVAKRVCKIRCKVRGCRNYLSRCYRCHIYCKCERCATEHTMKFPENEGIYPPQMFPQMIDNEFPNLSEEMPKGKTEQGETEM